MSALYLDPPIAASPTQRVEAPRMCDAIGTALRGAFDRDYSVPDEFVALLRRLDSTPDQFRSN